MQSVLILDPVDGASIHAVLAEQGFDVQVVESVADALIALREVDVSLVILDHTLPVSGWMLLPKLDGRAAIVCSAQQTVTDRVTSLRLGADDFVGKPFDGYELLERVRAVLRRVYPKPLRETSAIEVGDLTVDRTRVLVTVHGKVVHFTPTQFNLLALLADNPNELVRTEVIGKAVWGSESAVGHTIQVHLGRVRLALKRAHLSNPRIVNVRTWGYKLALEKEGERST